MSGSVLGHLTVSTPEATYAVGLEHSDFFNRPPFSTNFGIIPPGFGKRKNQTSNKFWDPAGIFSSTRNAEEKAGQSEDEIEGEETDNYKCLTDEMSKIYRHAPRDITIIDRVSYLDLQVNSNIYFPKYMLFRKLINHVSKFCSGQEKLSDSRKGGVQRSIHAQSRIKT